MHDMILGDDNGTSVVTKYGLWYPKGNNIIIHDFTDADWARSSDDH